LIKLAKKVRGDIHNDLNKCLYCGNCQKCRAKAITVNRKEKEWKWDDEKCVRCGHCIIECPAKSLSFCK
jgi:formate hydrogenlyase subunit 6/NADH:ubiquinone oxidoreductase subunit I